MKLNDIKIPLNVFMFFFMILCYCIYPAWCMPVSHLYRFMLINVFYFLVAVPLLLSGLKNYSFTIDFNPKYWRILLGLSLFSLLCHLPFINLPIITSLDEQSHVGFPAIFIGNLTRFLPAYIYLLILLILLIVFLKIKGYLMKHPVLLVIISFFAINLFFIFVDKYGLVEKYGTWQSIIRWPPVGKFINIFGFMVTGINEWVPRCIQLLFITATAVLIKKTVDLMEVKQNGILTYLLVMFFPTFFNLPNTAEPEGGTVFFFAVTAYFYLKSIKYKDKKDMYYCLLFLSVGFLYRQMMLGLFIVILFYSICLYITRKNDRNFYLTYIKNLWIPILAGFPLSVLGMVFGVRSSALWSSNLFHLPLLFLNLKTMAFVLGPGITGIIAVCCVYCILHFKFKNDAFNFLLVLFIMYYIMITGTELNGYIRHSQPFYLPIVIMIVIGTSLLLEKIGSRLLALSAQAVIISLFIYYSFFQYNPSLPTYQRINLTNMYEDRLPYQLFAEYLKNNSNPGKVVRVYAPMNVEPSHFYIAKYKLMGKVLWDRYVPNYKFSEKDISEYFNNGMFDFLFLPLQVPADMNIHISCDFNKLVEDLIKKRNFKIVKVFNYMGNGAVLLSK